MRPISTSSRLVLAAALVAVVVIGIAVLGTRSGVGPIADPIRIAAPPSASLATASPVAIALPTDGSVPVPGPTARPATPDPSASEPTPPSALVTATPSAEGDTLPELLALLAVAPEKRAGYDRSLFTHWVDADGDGCDTRREVLIAESLTPVAIGSGCRLTGGTWTSLYDGVTTTELATFDIDHVVALGEAWDSGASGWSPDRRMRFANDLGVDWALIAVTATSNRTKSDRDPTDWLPPLRAVRCEYLSMWIAVKVRWQLFVDVAERSTLRSLIGGCEQVMTVPIAR